MSLKSREYHLKRKYGISLAHYDQILDQQDYKCFICERPHTAFKTNLCVDHDHKTGELYGLLCHFCNHRFIGRNRKWEMYANAAVYLKSGLGVYVPVVKKRKQKSRKTKSRKG